MAMAGPKCLIDGAVYEIEPRHAPGMRVEVDTLHSSSILGSPIQIWQRDEERMQRFVARKHQGILDAWCLEGLSSPGKYIDTRGKVKAGLQLWKWGNDRTLASIGFRVTPTSTTGNGIEGGYFVKVEPCSKAGFSWDVDMASTKNGTPIITWLFTNGSNTQHRQFHFREVKVNSLHDSAKSGDLAKCKQLLIEAARQGHSIVNEGDSGRNRTPLHWACGAGHMEVVSLLLKSSANVNVKDGSGWTCLHRACYQGHDEIVALLIKHGAIVNVENDCNESPLHCAAGEGYVKCIKLLLANSAVVNAKDLSGWTPLHKASYFGRVQVISLLLDSGADLEAKNNSEETPRDLAKEEGQEEAVALLENVAAAAAGDHEKRLAVEDIVTLAALKSAASGEGVSFAYKLGERIGHGAYGEVFKARIESTGTTIAAKCLHSVTGRGGGGAVDGETRLRSLVREINSMKRLDHPNIVQYLGFDHTTSSSSSSLGTANDKYYILMEYVECGSLKSSLDSYGALSTAEAARNTKQILHALEYLHSQELVHRDLKSLNILQSKDGTLKLADLGCVKKTGESNTFNGTFVFMAPEVINQGDDHPSLGPSCDIWSLGGVVYEMLSGGGLPFETLGGGHGKLLRLVGDGGGPLKEALDEMVLHLSEKKRKSRERSKNLFSPKEASYSSSNGGGTEENNEEAISGLSKATNKEKGEQAEDQLAYDFLLQCFTFDSEARPTASELLEHDFVRKLADRAPHSSCGYPAKHATAKSDEQALSPPRTTGLIPTDRSDQGFNTVGQRFSMSGADEDLKDGREGNNEVQHHLGEDAHKTGDIGSLLSDLTQPSSPTVAFAPPSI